MCVPYKKSHMILVCIVMSSETSTCEALKRLIYSPEIQSYIHKNKRNKEVKYTFEYGPVFEE